MGGSVRTPAGADSPAFLMPRTEPREIMGDDAATCAALLALNNAHARELSWLEPERFRHLVQRRSWHA
jgi:predicted GNAT superfamily acetyltransferase